MTPEQKAKWVQTLAREGWQLDTHSTILSRRHSAHRTIGKLRFVKPLKPTRRTTTHE